MHASGPNRPAIQRGDQAEGASRLDATSADPPPLWNLVLRTRTQSAARDEDGQHFCLL
jgi:hypothetical protein